MAKMQSYWDNRYEEQGAKTVGCSSFTQEQFEEKTAKLKANLAPVLDVLFGGEKRLLDFGCGCGRLTEMLLRLGKEVYGVDIADWALEEAGTQVPGATFAICNDGLIPWPDNYFGGVLCWTVLQHIPPEEILQVTGEIMRVMNNGAWLLLYENISSWLPDKEHIWFRAAADYILVFSGLRCHRIDFVYGADDNEEIHALMRLRKDK
jgi:2-polyprenyl-3-methyl-5-hydroxy-6-metoxy-1,4-benzoquinol methylase